MAAGESYAPVIRAARLDELARLVAIELAAGAQFRSLGMDRVADDDPGSIEELTPYAESGRAFVAADAADQPIGYLLVDVVDGSAHIEQVSVHPLHARRGVGRALIEQATLWARSQDLDSVTLTTFVDVPWNGPYYERLGFRYLTPAEETPALRALREHERAQGLDAWSRASMRLRLTPEP